MNKFLLTLFLVGQCFRAINTDPWQEITHRVYKVGRFSYLVEGARQDTNHWVFYSFMDFNFKNMAQYEEVPCPNIKWEK